MQTVEYEKWVLEVDRPATQAIYSDIPESGAVDCGCDDCLRFDEMRSILYPASVLEVLDRLGVDPGKEVEVMSFGPDEDGRDIWNWWLLFVGRIKSGPDAAAQQGCLNYESVTDNFMIGFTEGISIPWAGFRDRAPLVQVECHYYASTQAATSAGAV